MNKALPLIMLPRLLQESGNMKDMLSNNSKNINTEQRFVQFSDVSNTLEQIYNNSFALRKQRKTWNTLKWK